MSLGGPTGACLDRQSILALLRASPPLVEGYLDLEAQLQPNGFDLSLASIAAFTSPGSLGATNAERVLAETTELPFGPDGYVMLTPGPYLLRFNEVVNLPLGLMALARPRSSLLRSGVAVHNAVWDAGYSGRSQALLTVYHPQGFRVARNARIVQMVFFRLEQPASQGYGGRFQGEGR
ncbi:MAG: deoxyuridine 5'-triphosphate nucleotidohydrolase [Dehalococcoidia bacterium]|nr:deoxyuridine 5'-triphosphate nucleotidohydrolase [Dehalococcoidia bacterium]